MRRWGPMHIGTVNQESIGFTSVKTISPCRFELQIEQHNCLEHIDETISRRSMRPMLRVEPWKAVLGVFCDEFDKTLDARIIDQLDLQGSKTISHINSNCEMNMI